MWRQIGSHDGSMMLIVMLKAVQVLVLCRTWYQLNCIMKMANAFLVGRDQIEAAAGQNSCQCHYSTLIDLLHVFQMNTKRGKKQTEDKNGRSQSGSLCLTPMTHDAEKRVEETVGLIKRTCQLSVDLFGAKNGKSSSSNLISPSRAVRQQFGLVSAADTLVDSREQCRFAPDPQHLIAVLWSFTSEWL